MLLKISLTALVNFTFICNKNMTRAVKCNGIVLIFYIVLTCNF